MTNISTAAANAREGARQSTGQFGEQDNSAPEAALVTDDGRGAALVELARILSGHPEQAEHARQFIEPKIGDTWAPEFAYVEYDDKLQRDQLDAYLRGDDEPLYEVDDRFREGDAYEDSVDEYLNDVLGTDPSDLDGDTLDELRAWAKDLDRSEVIPDLVRHGGDSLIQLPAVADDDVFGDALSAASVVDNDEERYAAIEQVFHKTLNEGGIVLNEHNKQAVRSLIDENSLDFGHQAAEQWRLRLVSYTDPTDVAMSSFGGRGDGARTVTVEEPWLLLVDPWNGRSHDVKLSGNFRTTINAERPARLDAALGYGSLDSIAGVYHSAYRTHVTVEETIA